MKFVSTPWFELSRKRIWNSIIIVHGTFEHSSHRSVIGFLPLLFQKGHERDMMGRVMSGFPWTLWIYRRVDFVMETRRLPIYIRRIHFRSQPGELGTVYSTIPWSHSQWIVRTPKPYNNVWRDGSVPMYLAGYQVKAGWSSFPVARLAYWKNSVPCRERT